jgi:hypothetical protein
MAGVNTMSFEDAAGILNNIRKQVTGEAAIAITDNQKFISVATTLLQAGYDPVLNAITQMVTKTIFSIRPYNRKFAGIKMDSEQWGAIVRKLSISDKDWDQDVRFDLIDGQSVDMYKVNKPNVLQTNFYGQNVFEKNYTIFRDQLDNAFSGASEFGRFMSMVVQNVSDMIEQAHESIARMTIGNFVGGKVVAANSVIHLLTEYNAETGESLTSTTVYAPANFGNFMKWMYARVATLTALMTERSQKFQINVTGKEINRHTPFEYQKVYLYAPLLNAMNARVLADAYHDDFLEYSDVEAVNYWQAIDNPMQVKVTPSYMNASGQIVTAAEQTITNLVGVLFDQDALGYTTVNNWSATTPLNAKGGYWNTFHHFTERWYNDFTEKGIVLLLD